MLFFVMDFEDLLHKERTQRTEGLPPIIGNGLDVCSLGNTQKQHKWIQMIISVVIIILT